jgi:hypothetical protein
MCVHTFISTQAFRGNSVQMAVVPSVLNAGDFQKQYDWDVEFVHSGVDRGWHYWIISVSLTHAAAVCNLNTQQFQLLLSQCKTYSIVM